MRNLNELFGQAVYIQGFPEGTSGLKKKKNPPANAGDARNTSSIPGSGRSPGVGSGNPLQHSCLEDSMDRGAWTVTVQGGRKESDTEQLSTHTHTVCIHTHTSLSVPRVVFCLRQIDVQTKVPGQVSLGK